MEGIALSTVDKALSEIDWALGKLKEELSADGMFIGFACTH
jgi:hypothetical protein